MKAISIWQPWATLVATGRKGYETRSWSTNYRGPLLICAAKHQLTNQQLMALRQELEFPPYSQLPFGKALCIVDLVGVYPTLTLNVTDKERLLGDFLPGRFAWDLRNIRRFKTRFAVRGRQGLFDWPDDIVLSHELEKTS